MDQPLRLGDQVDDEVIENLVRQAERANSGFPINGTLEEKSQWVSAELGKVLTK